MMRNLKFTDEAWNSYIYWQTQDRKTLKRINDLIKDAQRSPFEGIGKPEALKHSLSGCWSRRIDETNRLVYQVEDEELVIISCRYHYCRRKAASFAGRRRHKPTAPSPAASIAHAGASGTGDTGEADIMLSTVFSFQSRWCSAVL